MANSVINGHTSIYSSLPFLFSLSSFLLQPLPTSLSTPSSLHAGALKNPQQQQRIEIHSEIPSNRDNLLKDIQSSILTNSSWVTYQNSNSILKNWPKLNPTYNIINTMITVSSQHDQIEQNKVRKGHQHSSKGELVEKELT